jgi:uncharacterized protein
MNAQDRRFAVVTGASSGIGLELARILADEDYELLISAEDELDVVAAERSSEGAGRLRDVPEERGRRDQGRPQAVSKNQTERSLR